MLLHCLGVLCVYLNICYVYEVLNYFTNKLRKNNINSEKTININIVVKLTLLPCRPPVNRNSRKLAWFVDSLYWDRRHRSVDTRLSYNTQSSTAALATVHCPHRPRSRCTGDCPDRSASCARTSPCTRHSSSSAPRTCVIGITHTN